MSEPLTFAQIADAVGSVQRDYDGPSFRQVAQGQTRYEIFQSWFKEDKVIVDTGYGIERQLMTEHDDDEVHTGPYAEDQVDFSDVMAKMRVDFVLAKIGYTFNYEEVVTNRGEGMLYDLIETRRSSKMLNLIKKMEERGWQAPSGPNDDLMPWGVAYWVVRNATRGFTGGYPTGFTDLANIDLDDHPNFKNWSNPYTDISRQDLIYKMREGREYTDFVSPLEVGGEGDVIAETYRTYMNTGTYLDLEMKMEDQNDNLGPDIGKSNAGRLMFNGNPCVAVRYLDNDAQDPVYTLCHDVFKPMVQAQNFLRESDLIRSSKNSDQYLIFINLKYNYVCFDRRRNAVYYRNV